ncbi:MAG: thioredoxin [Candidatus Thermoplasmatota archaeon]
MSKWKFWEKEEDRKEVEEWPSSVSILKNKDEFNEFIKKYPLVVVDFWASWCKPCKKIEPRIRRLSKLFKGKTAFGKINIEKNKDIAKEYNIMSIPALVIFKNGKKEGVLTGVKSVGKIKKTIKKYL